MSNCIALYVIDVLFNINCYLYYSVDKKNHQVTQLILLLRKSMLPITMAYQVLFGAALKKSIDINKWALTVGASGKGNTFSGLLWWEIIKSWRFADHKVDCSPLNLMITWVTVLQLFSSVGRVSPLGWLKTWSFQKLIKLYPCQQIWNFWKISGLENWNNLMVLWFSWWSEKEWDKLEVLLHLTVIKRVNISEVNTQPPFCFSEFESLLIEQYSKKDWYWDT